MERAPGRPSAQTSTLKPAGTLSLSTGSSLAALPVTSIAKGCKGELACSAPRPCCQEGGAEGGCWANAAVVNAARNAGNTTARGLRGFMSPPFDYSSGGCRMSGLADLACEEK